jgi:hypothetical protein
MASRVTIALRRMNVCRVRAAIPALSASFATRPDAVVKKGSKKDKDLASVLERELQYEKEDNDSTATIKEVTEGLEGWTVTEDAGCARFAVTKKVR